MAGRIDKWSVEKAIKLKGGHYDKLCLFAIDSFKYNKSVFSIQTHKSLWIIISIPSLPPIL